MARAILPADNITLGGDVTRRLCVLLPLQVGVRITRIGKTSSAAAPRASKSAVGAYRSPGGVESPKSGVLNISIILRSDGMGTVGTGIWAGDGPRASTKGG